MAHAEEEVEDVRHLVADPGLLLGVGQQGLDIGVGLEAELFQQLGGFRDNPDGKVLGAVEPVPVPGLAEGLDFGFQLLQVGLGVHAKKLIPTG